MYVVRPSEATWLRVFIVRPVLNVSLTSSDETEPGLPAGMASEKDGS